MPSIELHPILLVLLCILPAILVFLIQKAISNKQQNHFLDLEKESLALNATILDLEMEINTLKKELEENKLPAGIVRMDEKQKKGII